MSLPSKQETIKSLGLHRPPKTLEILNFLRLRQITPSDISTKVDALFEQFPDLGGDPELGPGNYGNCQSWRGDWKWHQDFLSQHQVK